MRILKSYCLVAIALVMGATVMGATAFTSGAQAARVSATVDLSAQRMYVSIGGKPAYSWAVSTGRKGYRTPTGSYRPTRMYRKYFSRKYHGSPMPNSIFFRGGYAIHGTGYTKSLGRPASHGCVRLHPTHARTLYNIVRQHGSKNTKISIRH